MTSKKTQILNKRSIKPKTQYSPSNPTTATTYHLILYPDTNNMMIVGNSSIKRQLNNGNIMLNDGQIVKLITSGNSFLI